jgi:hypothetical protein
MLGLLLSTKEAREIEYLLKKELEELLLDLEDERISGLVRRAMEERYKLIFNIYRRFVSSQESAKYIRKGSTHV